jgi:predicted aspartyl protease
MHDATIIWDGIACQILVQASECVPLLGSELLKGYELRARFIDGGRVELEKIP